MNRSGQKSARRGFTIVEIIVVVGVLAVLMGLLLPAMASVRAAARRTSEVTAARQMFAAYSNYATTWNDSIIAGYRTTWDDGDPVRARDASGTDLAEYGVPGIAAARYPWRLAGYLDYNFESLYLNDQGSELEEYRTQSDESYYYIVSLFPSLGLNARWVGGHEGQLAWSPQGVDTFGKFWIDRMSAATRPDELIVFASARGSDPAFPEAGVVEGYFDIRSPNFVSTEWADEWHTGLAPDEFGHLSLRHHDEAVTATMDGSVTTLSEVELRDMRRWANGATSEDWTLTPR